MQSQPSSPGPDAIPSSSHPLPHPTPIVSNSPPKHHHKFKAAQMSISEHLANIREVEEVWYKRNRQLAMESKQDVDKLYREIQGNIAKITRLQVS